MLVSTDVLEHVPDPLKLLAEMVDAVRPSGHLIFANEFFPVILCHLSWTFHLRYSFDSLCQALGLQVLGPCEGSHATTYPRSQVLEPNWRLLCRMERRILNLFPRRGRRVRHLTLWNQLAQLAVTHPLRNPSGC